MKRNIVVLLITVLCLLLSVVYAEKPKGVNEINYRVSISGEPAFYNSTENNGEALIRGLLHNNDQIDIYYEEERDDNSVFFYFTNAADKNDVKWGEYIKKIARKDIQLLTEAPQEKPTLSPTTEKIVIMAWSGVQVYIYPSFVYKEKELIFNSTKITVQHVDGVGDGNWFYALEYDGYVYLPGNKFGYAPEKEILTPTAIPLYKTQELYKESNNVLLEIPQNKSFGSYVVLPNNAIYVTYNGRDGYLDPDDVAYQALSGESSKVAFPDLNLYEEGDFNSRPLWEFLPLNTEYAWEYATNMDEYGWVKTKYRGIEGWIFTINPNRISDEKVRNNYFESIKKGYDIRKEGRIVVPVVEVPSGDSGETIVEENSGEQEAPTDIIDRDKDRDDPPPIVTPPEVDPISEPPEVDPAGDKAITKIIIYLAIAIVIIVIIILLILRSKNKWYKKKYNYSNYRR